MYNFKKYYKHLFRFQFYVDECEAADLNWLSARNVESYQNMEVLSISEIPLERIDDIEGRGVSITIPEGVTILIHSSDQENREHMAVLEIKGNNSLVSTKINVRGDELPYILKTAQEETLVDTSKSFKNRLSKLIA